MQLTLVANETVSVDVGRPKHVFDFVVGEGLSNKPCHDLTQLTGTDYTAIKAEQEKLHVTQNTGRTHHGQHAVRFERNKLGKQWQI